MPEPMPEFTEALRRKPNAQGFWIRLGDGESWLLPITHYRLNSSSLTCLELTFWIDRFHEQSSLGEEIELADLAAVARILLLENYQLTDQEISELLCVVPGPELAGLGQAVFRSLFGSVDESRTYLRWVRASLAAAGLQGITLNAETLADVLSILVATGRTVPATNFIDACREAEFRESLEQLV